MIGGGPSVITSLRCRAAFRHRSDSLRSTPAAAPGTNRESASPAPRACSATRRATRTMVPSTSHGGVLQFGVVVLQRRRTGVERRARARRHAAADSQNRHRPAHLVGHCQRIVAGRRFDPWLLVLRARRPAVPGADPRRRSRASRTCRRAAIRSSSGVSSIGIGIAQRQSRRRIEAVDQLDRRKDFRRRARAECR